MNGYALTVKPLTARWSNMIKVKIGILVALIIALIYITLELGGV